MTWSCLGRPYRPGNIYQHCDPRLVRRLRCGLHSRSGQHQLQPSCTTDCLHRCFWVGTKMKTQRGAVDCTDMLRHPTLRPAVSCCHVPRVLSWLRTALLCKGMRHGGTCDPGPAHDTTETKKCWGTDGEQHVPPRLRSRQFSPRLRHP